MAENQTTTGTPGSGADSVSGGRNYAAKDKICQFCNAPFTSSSLGRHLDLYIRDKNPKPPDGVHDPDQIREIRGNITRRKNRKSSGNRDPSESRSQPPSQSTPGPLRPSEDAPAVTSGWHATNGVSGAQRKPSIRMNEPTWEVTGVINGLSAVGREPVEPRRDVSSKSHAKTAINSRQRLAESTTEQRAVELALKEVLDSIKAATSRATPANPFDFSPLELTFPELCLKLLSPPSTIFSTHPIPSASSWSVDAPGPAQLEAVNIAVRRRFAAYKRELTPLPAELNLPRPDAMETNWARSPRSTSSPPAAGQNPAQPDYNEQQVHEHELAVLSHVDSAFKHWSSIPDSQRNSQWTLEALKAFARSSEQEKRVSDKLFHAKQEINSLQQQVERLSTCQAPREHLFVQPSTFPVSQKLAEELKSGDLKTWDFEPLVSKWRGVVTKQRDRQHLALQRPLPSGTSSELWASRNGITANMRTESTASVDPDEASETSVPDLHETNPDPMDTDSVNTTSPLPPPPHQILPQPYPQVNQGQGQTLAPKPIPRQTHYLPQANPADAAKGSREPQIHKMEDASETVEPSGEGRA